MNTRELSFVVEGYPPTKDGANSIMGKTHKQAPRVLKLLQSAHERAEETGFPGLGAVAIGFELVLACPRDHMRGDGTNYMGGIADVLEDKGHRKNIEHLGDLAAFGLYANDRQIEEAHYRWRPAAEPSYAVRFWALPS